MNELPPSSSTDPSASPQPATPAAERQPGAAAAASAASGPAQGRRPASAGLVYSGLVALGLLLAAQWWSSHEQIAGLREELAQRLRTGDVLNAETKVIAKSVQDNLKELQAKVNVLENKQLEAQSQQLALEQLYQDLSKTRDEWVLAEIEQVLSIASQQLELAGNVQGALIALQSVEQRLSRLDEPQFISIRRAVARDLDRLRALPNVDLVGIALRLDHAIEQVDDMPLLSSEKPAETGREQAAGAEPAPASEPAAQGTWLATLNRTVRAWANEIWTEIRELIRVHDVKAPEALLLSPTQGYYARENLKLRLLNARLAVITRNEAMFKRDIIAAQEAINKYFDVSARQTQAVQALLRQVQTSNVSIEVPTLAESLAALRNYKATP